MIGMFVATLPHRLQLDPHCSFNELVKHVQELCLSIAEHAHYPLQQILADEHLNQSNPLFLETAFDLISMSSTIDQFSFDEASIENLNSYQSSEAAKFDCMLTFIYNPTVDHGGLSYRLVCSSDLFDQATVITMARRFQHLIHQLFMIQPNVIESEQLSAPIRTLSLILNEEFSETQHLMVHRQYHILEKGMPILISLST
jgi:non-ribosomal peptide synthetase component F